MKKMLLLSRFVLQQCLSNFYKQNCVKTNEIKFSRKHWPKSIGAKIFLHFNEVKCFCFLKAWCNQLWATFTNRTVSRQAKSSIHEKIQDHCSEPNDYCISMKQNVFALLKSGVTNCKQLYKQNCVETSEMKYWRKHSPSPETTAQS